MSGEDRRQAIVTAASSLFARKGFHGTSTADIAAAAGCSEPMLYKHFSSKQELFASCLKDGGLAVKERVLDVLEQADDPLAALLNLSRTLMTEPRWAELQRMRALAMTMADDPEIAAALRFGARGHCGTIAAVVRDAQARGRIRADVDPEAIGWMGVALSQLANYRNAIEGADGLRETAKVMDALMTMLQLEETR
jgi:AcrR family transcriptional regulator